MDGLAERLAAVLRASPSTMRVLDVARDLDLPDWLLFSGAIYQPVWNHLTGRPLDYGAKDYDIGYFDADTRYEAEDTVIRRVAAAFEPLLAAMVEVRNQARVHLWFEQRFGEAYTPLTRTADALGRFTSPAFAVGVRLRADDRFEIEAPFGLEDLFAMRLRPNPLRPSANFLRIAANVAARWPEATVGP